MIVAIKETLEVMGEIGAEPFLDIQSCYDRLLPASRNKPVNLNIWQKLIMFFISSK